jgi:pyridoxal phosphate enzyme (YggS family)
VSLSQRLDEVRDRIAGAAAEAGRDPTGVTLVAVSKGFGADVIVEAVEAGVSDLGENRAQELEAKVGFVTRPVRWHFVGRLQRNKVRTVVGACALIHSVDRPRLADAIARRARADGLVQDVLVEVNVSGEVVKGGVAAEDAVAFVEGVAALEGVRVRGLMTIPPWPKRPEDSTPHYRRLREVRDRLVRVVPEAAELSMGMSRDFEVAIREGATIVRVGEAIFGTRPRV